MSVIDGNCHVMISGVGGSTKVQVKVLAVKILSFTVAVAEAVIVSVQLV